MSNKESARELASWVVDNADPDLEPDFVAKIEAALNEAEERGSRFYAVATLENECLVKHLKPIPRAEIEKVREALDRNPNCPHCMDSSYRIEALAIVDGWLSGTVICYGTKEGK